MMKKHNNVITLHYYKLILHYPTICFFLLSALKAEKETSTTTRVSRKDKNVNETFKEPVCIVLIETGI